MRRRNSRGGLIYWINTNVLKPITRQPFRLRLWYSNQMMMRDLYHNASTSHMIIVNDGVSIIDCVLDIIYKYIHTTPR